MRRLSSESETAGIPHPLFLDIEALRKVAGYAHWIPLIRGLHKDYFARNLPGWEWNQIIPVLIKKGIIKVGSKEAEQLELSQGLSISKDVEGVVIRLSKHATKVTVHKISTNRNKETTMGVWDMMYLVQKYKKLLCRSENLAFSEVTRADFAEQAEAVRAQMIRYMERAKRKNVDPQV